MFKNKIFLGFFSILLLLPLASISEATIWDLQIFASVQNSPLYSGDRPIVTGIITDQASKPVSNATVNVRSGSMSIFTTTSNSGEFLAELGKHDRMPGNYIVNISATTQEGKTGIASTSFQVKGELTPMSVSQQKLSTPEAQKYLEASPDQFKNNPLGFMLYNYYQKIYQEYLKEEKITEELAKEQLILNEQKIFANSLRQKAIEEYQPSMGIFSGEEYERYVNNLDEEVRDTVIEHLEFTKKLVEEAQILRNEILANGGTAEEAQNAYLEKIATSRDLIENLDNPEHTKNNLEKNFDESIDENTHSDENSEPASTVNEELVKNPPVKLEFDGVNLEVDYEDSIFFVNVNGEVLKFVVIRDEISLIENHE